MMMKGEGGWRMSMADENEQMNEWRGMKSREEWIEKLLKRMRQRNEGDEDGRQTFAIWAWIPWAWRALTAASAANGDSKSTNPYPEKERRDKDGIILQEWMKKVFGETVRFYGDVCSSLGQTGAFKENEWSQRDSSTPLFNSSSPGHVQGEGNGE